MTSHKTLGEEVSFKAEPRTGAIIRIYFIAAVGMGVMSLFIIFIISVMTAIFDFGISSVTVGFIGAALSYIFLFLLFQAMKMVGAEGVADALDVAGAF